MIVTIPHGLNKMIIERSGVSKQTYYTFKKGGKVKEETADRIRQAIKHFSKTINFLS